jgi:uncharacterized protein YkwD
MAASAAVIICLIGLVSAAEVGGVRADGQPITRVVRASSRSVQTEKSAAVERVADMIVKQTNRFRRRKGREAVTVNAELTETAREFADFMAETDKYGHEADGTRPWERARKHKYVYCALSENIAMERTFADRSVAHLARFFVSGWERSPGHRKNLLDPDVLETGVAVAVSENSGICYAVQMFGRPKSATITFQIENNTDHEVTYRIGTTSATLHPEGTDIVPQCVPTDVVFTWPRSEGESATFHPAEGDRFIISKQAGVLHVRKSARPVALPAPTESRTRPAGP